MNEWWKGTYASDLLHRNWMQDKRDVWDDAAHTNNPWYNFLDVTRRAQWKIPAQQITNNDLTVDWRNQQIANFFGYKIPDRKPTKKYGPGYYQDKDMDSLTKWNTNRYKQRKWDTGPGIPWGMIWTDEYRYMGPRNAMGLGTPKGPGLKYQWHDKSYQHIDRYNKRGQKSYLQANFTDPLIAKKAWRDFKYDKWHNYPDLVGVIGLNTKYYLNQLTSTRNYSRKDYENNSDRPTGNTTILGKIFGYKNDTKKFKKAKEKKVEQLNVLPEVENSTEDPSGYQYEDMRRTYRRKYYPRRRSYGRRYRSRYRY